MVGSCGADASMVASWVGWIRTLASVLVVSLGGIVSSAGVMGLDGFKEVRNGMRGFMCVISVRGLSSLDAWLWGSIGIFTIFLGFTRCFHKPFRCLEIILQRKGKKKNIFVAHFEAWKSFYSHFEAWRSFHNHLEVWKSFGNKMGISQPMFSPCFWAPLDS